MKKVIPCFFFLALVTGFFASCKKEVKNCEQIKEITIDTTLAAGTDYQLQLAPLGDDDDIVDILQQPNSFSVSRIENLSDVFNPVYHFKSTDKSNGPDQVVLAVSKNPMSRNYNKDSTIVYINLLIK